MNIIEATQKALEQNKWITRTTAWWGKRSELKPSDGLECYITHSRTLEKEGIYACKPRWHPTSEDILADDWEVVEKPIISTNPELL